VHQWSAEEVWEIIARVNAHPALPPAVVAGRWVGVNGCGGRKAFEVTESVEGLDKFLGVGQGRDEVGLGNWCRELGGFSSWPSKRRAG
jgi:hypothetical protein